MRATKGMGFKKRLNDVVYVMGDSSNTYPYGTACSVRYWSSEILAAVLGGLGVFTFDELWAERVSSKKCVLVDTG
jgi:hypothetical protein